MEESDQNSTQSLEPPMPKDWLGAMRESKYKYIFVILIPCLIFVPFLYIDVCLSLLILPFSVALMLYLLRITNIWYQLACGVVALCVVTLIISAMNVSDLSNLQEIPVDSIEGKLANGTVTPWTGDEQTLYNYTVQVFHEYAGANITVYVNITEDMQTYSPILRNETMSLVSFDNATGTWRYNYSYETTLSKTVNAFGFDADINGIWYHTDRIYGPVSTNTGAMFGEVTYLWFTFILAWCLPQFLIMIFFLRFMARSREARVKMQADYRRLKTEREKELQEGDGAAEEPKRLSISTGASDTFVCSECGADVNSTANFCPNCGEPFEDEEEGEDSAEGGSGSESDDSGKGEQT